MANITARVGEDKFGPEKSGPEQYAPPDRRPLEKPRADDQAVNALESELREFVRHDVSLPQQGDVDPANRAPENLNTLIQRIAGASIAEIDRVIIELEGVRNMLRKEGERLNQEAARYANLANLSISAMKTISDSLKPSKGVPNSPADRSSYQ